MRALRSLRGRRPDTGSHQRVGDSDLGLSGQLFVAVVCSLVIATSLRSPDPRDASAALSASARIAAAGVLAASQCCRARVATHSTTSTPSRAPPAAWRPYACSPVGSGRRLGDPELQQSRPRRPLMPAGAGWSFRIARIRVVAVWWVAVITRLLHSVAARRNSFALPRQRHRRHPIPADVLS